METEAVVESEREKGFNYSSTKSKYYACNRAKYGCKAKFTIENGVVSNQQELEGDFSQPCSQQPTNYTNALPQNTSLGRSLLNEGNVSKNTQPTVNNSDLFQSPRKTKQQELEEKIAFLESKVNEYILNEAKEHLSHTHSFASNILTNWDSLSRTSQESLLSEATKLLLDEKDKRIKSLEEQSTSRQSHEQCNRLVEELKSDKSKLEKKVEDRVKEKDDLVDRFKRKEDYWSSLYMKMFTAAETNESLAALFRTEGAQMRSQLTSVVPSLHQSLCCSQDGSASPQVQTDNEQMQINTNEEEEKKDSDVTVICPYCNVSFSGPPHVIKASYGQIEMSGTLYNHWKTSCSHFDEYHTKLTQVAAQALEHPKLLWSQFKLILTEIDQVIQCFKLSTEFELNKAEVTKFLTDWKLDTNKKYPFPTVSSNSNMDMIADDMKFLQMFGSLASKKYYHKSEAYNRRNEDHTILENVTSQVMQEQLDEMHKYWCPTCQKLFVSRDIYEKHKIFDQADFRKKVCISNKCDVFQDGQYEHSYGSGMLRKRTRSIPKAELVKIDLELKRFKKVSEPKAQKTALERNRINQTKIIKDQVIKSRDQLMKVEDWLRDLAKQCARDDVERSRTFEKLDSIICDGIVITKVPSYGNQSESKLKQHLLSFNIPVKLICDAKIEGCHFVYLTDTGNEFTGRLLENLRSAMQSLEIQGVFIRQIDCTQDLSGFFLSVNVSTDLDNLAKALNMPISQRKHKQLMTCFQFEDIENGQPIRRMKVYNKLVHLLTNAQFNWLGMNTNKLFQPESAFYHSKISPGCKRGLSRIELSTYFYTIEEQRQGLLDIGKFAPFVHTAFRKLQEQGLCYSISLKQMLQSFFTSLNTIFFSFQENKWAVCYAHSQISCRYVGHLVNRTNDCGMLSDFIKRFAYEKKSMHIYINNKFFDDPSKLGSIIQIPIPQLHHQHKQRYPFDLPQGFLYDMNTHDLNQIQLVSKNQELLELLGFKFKAAERKRDVKTKDKELMSGGILVGHLLEPKRFSNVRFLVYKAPSKELCQFKASDQNGRVYRCVHKHECNKQLERRGQGGKAPLYLL